MARQLAAAPAEFWRGGHLDVRTASARRPRPTVERVAELAPGQSARIPYDLAQAVRHPSPGRLRRRGDRRLPRGGAGGTAKDTSGGGEHSAERFQRGSDGRATP